MAKKTQWDKRYYHGRYNRYPFTEVVSFVMRNFGGAPDRSKVRVLDLGYGGGHHLMLLAQEGFDYFGVDGASGSIQIATRRLAEVGLKARNLAVATFDHLPYPDGFFDAVIDRGSLVCNRLAELPPLIEEVRRTLKPGGMFFSMILHESCTSKNDARALGDNDYTDFGGRLKDAGVLHFTNAREARKLFGAFHLVDIERTTTKSEYPPAGNKTVIAWTLVTCRK
jgi:SAM-dependent methyltransferase